MSEDSTLIIKLGAMGDVLRTTTIVRALPGPVTWVTRPASLPLLENIPQIRQVVPFEAAPEELQGRHFGLAACLDDEPEACALLERVTFDRHVGARAENGRIVYAAEARSWYDMGLVSRFGKERADELKRLNTRSYQEHLFGMFGLEFRGEDYLFGTPPHPASRQRVGIEMRADARWQLKRWGRYPDLIERLRADGFEVFVFEQRDDLRDFIADVNSCGLVVTGDTLTMHVALALHKRVIAVFGPTSGPEIHGYGRLTSIVSPIECICCYLRTCDKSPNCMDLITFERLHEAVLDAAREPA
jgi:lipopolysaccharide heptosyltransferase II